MPYSDDANLITGCLQGEQHAWDTLVERYGRLVYSVPRRYGLRAADAEDVFQNTFAALHRSLEKLRDQSRLSAWLITTAHRESWRVGKQRGNYPQLDERIADVGSPRTDELETWERRQLVREGLQQLGGRCEQLLALLFLHPDPPSYDDIATQLDMRVGSIGPTRTRCFEKLEAILRRRGLE